MNELSKYATPLDARAVAEGDDDAFVNGEFNGDVRQRPPGEGVQHGW